MEHATWEGFKSQLLGITAILGWNRVALSMELFPKIELAQRLPYREQGVMKHDWNRYSYWERRSSDLIERVAVRVIIDDNAVFVQGQVRARREHQGDRVPTSWEAADTTPEARLNVTERQGLGDRTNKRSSTTSNRNKS